MSNSELTNATTKALKKPLWPPNVPSFVLVAVSGEMGRLILEGSRASAEKSEKGRI
ncbi:MAG: hypothetical protein WBG42_07860 [Cryomorphaceae bacterium]